MHILQPKHSKASQSEAKAMMAKYNISTTQLPRIKIGDKALSSEVKVGDIVKIERKTTAGEKAFYYRVVVD